MPESAGLQAKTPDSAKARPEPRVTVEPIEAGYIEGMPSPATIARTLEDPAEMARANSIARRAVSNRQVLKLQRSVGNRVAGAAFGRLAQRVPITASTSETLYNQENAGTGQATASSYGGDKTYDITRQGNTGATVLVKIKFLSQARNTTPPGPNPPAGTPRLGQMLGSPTQFPDGDERRAWATNMAAQAVTHWNGHVSFVSDTPSETAGFDTVRLPVTFQSEAVFGIDEDAHNTVIVHGTATTAGTDGHPIDAGNWYMNKGTRYPANDDVIYAHEYGHLIGIPDEYSQSNEQMNALLHQASPGDAAASLATLDEETVRRMAHTAIARPLFQQFRAAMPPAVAAFNAQGRMVKRKMSDAAKDAVLTSAVQEQLRDRLLVEATERMDAQVSQTVAFQTTTNFSNKSRAGEGVDAVFNAAALSGRFRSLYASALDGSIPGGTVDVSGLGDVAINISSAVWSAGVGGGANQASASAVAGGNVGAAAPASGLPEMPPPDTLVGQIGALPATWADAGSAVESSITPAAFAAKMQAIMPTAAAAMAEAVVAAATGGTGPAALATSGQLYRRAYSILANAAREAATQLASELVQSQVEPVIQTSVTAFSTALDAEVARVMTMSPAELAAAGNPDPNLRQFVQDMKGRLDADKAATASTGRNPLGATGGTAPDQDVTYSVQSLMGSNQTTAVRADQFRPMADQFNANFKATTEEPFRPETT